MKLDIKVFNNYYYKFCGDSREIVIEQFDERPETDNRVLMWYDDAARYLIIGNSFYTGQQLETFINVYTIIDEPKIEDGKYIFGINDCLTETIYQNKNNVILTKTIFKNEIKKYFANEVKRLETLKQLLGI